MRKMFFVEIVRYAEEEVVKRMGPFHERKVEKIELGIDINLNHDEYYSRIVDADICNTK